jgi:D-alanyl-D-alanine carboxypeptidase/D-alanyl-D-alanine-endopeptidase (penicillin-binding protein 4)
LLSSCASQDQLYKEKPAFYSYIVGDVKTDHIYSEHYADVYATPASCQKVITALVAFKTFGLDYFYETQLFTTQKKEIVIAFSGDPTLTSEDLTNLLRPCAGSKKKIILDASIFQLPPHSANLMLDDLGRSYAQPVSGMNLDGNLIDAKTSPKDIGVYILDKMNNILQKLKIKGKIEIVYDKKLLPANLELVGSVRSKSLREIIPPAFKKSDNLLFDSLYLTIIHKFADVQDWADGDHIIKNLVKQYYDIDLENSLVIDGSGISRYNRLMPRKLLELLRHGFDIPEFVDAMPQPGEVETTLEKRTNLPNNVRAKTGSMLSINCLCGYIMRPKKPKAFVVMSNSFATPTQESSDAIDRFVKKSAQE